MLAIIIVSWNVRDLLRACLLSLEHYPATTHQQKIIVVDNASTDGSVQMVAAEFPLVTIVANTTNRGFTGGNNDGIRAGETFFTGQFDAQSYIFLLNPDTEVTPGALDTLLDYADTHADVGVVGPLLLNSDGSHQSSRRSFPTLATAMFESTWLQTLAPHKILDRYYLRDKDDNSICDVDWLVGAALLVRRSSYLMTGLLDDVSFFMYSEELDWCKRIKSQPLQPGWRVVYVPTAHIVHHEGRSSMQVSTRRMIYFNTSKVRYFRKHHGARQAQVLRLSLIMQFRLQYALEGAKWLLGRSRPLRQERMRAYREVIRSGLL